MSNLPRRTVDEIKARYFCEPGLYDVYVEGEFDWQVISSWCTKRKEERIVPYEIDTVDIPLELLNKYNLTEGNKQRIIALAKELSTEDLEGYRCLVDKDLDHWLDLIDDTKNLLWTEYCSLELYYFNEELIKRIILEVSNSKISDWSIFFNSFIDVLKQLYCLRLTNASMGLNINWIELDKYIKCKENSLSFDTAIYAERTLIQNGHGRLKKDFLDCVSIWNQRLDGDPRLYIRGHDFVKLISLANKEFKGVKSFHEEKTIERLFVAFVDEIHELIDSIIKSL